MKIFVIILLISLLILLVLSYSLLIIAGKEEERAERMYRKWKEEHDDLRNNISDSRHSNSKQ